MYHAEQADYYARYRPELHDVALELYVSGERFGNGLDVGCGAGHSTHALLPYCQDIVGIDNSRAMLDRAMPAGKIRYRLVNGASWPVASGWADLITLAGVLFYLDPIVLARELLRVAAPGCRVIVYDFTFDPIPVMKDLGVGDAGIAVSGYSASCDLPVSGHWKADGATSVREVDLFVPLHNMVWLLLAEEGCRIALLRRFGRRELVQQVITRLTRTARAWNKYTVPFRVVAKAYRLRAQDDAGHRTVVAE